MIFIIKVAIEQDAVVPPIFFGSGHPGPANKQQHITKCILMENYISFTFSYFEQ
jgi:hypothetical protein